jgi:hypothetical protein
MFFPTNGNHPFQSISDEALEENATCIVTDQDSRELDVDNPFSILNWFTRRKPCVPRREIEGPIDETREPLIRYVLSNALRVPIRDLKPVEAVGRIYTIEVNWKARSRSSLQVTVMLPCEEKVAHAWKLYYHAARNCITYLMEGDYRVARRYGLRRILGFLAGRRRIYCVSTVHRAEAARCLRSATREIIEQSPGVLGVGELAYILCRWMGPLTCLCR